MTTELFDPTTAYTREPIQYAPRPAKLAGLRLGLVENTKHNSKALLLKIAKGLEEKYAMETVHLESKHSPSHGISEEALRAFRSKADFVITGIGD